MSELENYYEQIATRSAGKAGLANTTGALGAQPGSLGTAAGGDTIKASSSEIGGGVTNSSSQNVLFPNQHGTVNTYSVEPDNRSAKDGQGLEILPYTQKQARIGNQSPNSDHGNAGLGPEIFR